MRKIAIVFPGVGYTKDRPLLYYAGKLAVKHGYELRFVDFSGLDWSKDKLKDRDFLRETLEKCMKITEKALDGMLPASVEESFTPLTNKEDSNAYSPTETTPFGRIMRAEMLALLKA